MQCKVLNTPFWTAPWTKYFYEKMYQKNVFQMYIFAPNSCSESYIFAAAKLCIEGRVGTREKI